jgi:hypothetical protein
VALLLGALMAAAVGGGGLHGVREMLGAAPRSQELAPGAPQAPVIPARRR